MSVEENRLLSTENKEMCKKFILTGKKVDVFNLRQVLCYCIEKNADQVVVKLFKIRNVWSVVYA